MAKTRRAQARGRQADLRHRRRRVRARPRGADLRRAHLHAHHRRRGVDAVGGRDDRGHPPDQAELPGVHDLARRVERVLRPRRRRRARCSTRVFLHHCVEAGLDLAIVNPTHITPYAEISDEERELADDLVFNRREDALAALHRALRADRARRRRTSGKADPTAGMEPEEALHWHDPAPQEGGRRGLDRPRRCEKIGAVPTLNEVLLPAMKEVGDKFGAGELILPFVLQSAEVMKKAVAHLENFLERDRGLHQGQGRARDGVRRRARHRQVARQHDPLQQRLHRVRPRQAGAGQHDHRRRRSRSSADAIGLSALLVSHLEADAARACRSCTSAGSSSRC